MGFLDSFFKSSTPELIDSIKVDMHNHLIFGVDDGAHDIEESMDLINGLVALGRKKIIMTPHIMSDFYKNGPDTILPKLKMLQEEVLKNKIDVTLEAAAEYYLDEEFVRLVESNKPLLSFGKNYVLFETAFMNESRQLNSVVFEMKSRGYKPILAHPERYIYLHDDFEKFEMLYERDILFQLNILSLSGYYSNDVKKVAEKLVDAKMVNFISSDCHSIKHINELSKAINSKYYKKLMDLPLLNNSLL